MSKQTPSVIKNIFNLQDLVNEIRGVDAVVRNTSRQYLGRHMHVLPTQEDTPERAQGIGNGKPVSMQDQIEQIAEALLDLSSTNLSNAEEIAPSAHSPLGEQVHLSLSDTCTFIESTLVDLFEVYKSTVEQFDLMFNDLESVDAKREDAAPVGDRLHLASWSERTLHVADKALTCLRELNSRVADLTAPYRDSVSNSVDKATPYIGMMYAPQLAKEK